MYKTEHEFSKALITKLKQYHAVVTRLESHSTANGIPDMYVLCNGFDCFIELKNDTKQSIKQKTFKIPYRPGQQAWYENYHRHMPNKSVVTLMSVSDGVVVIRNDRVLIPYIIFKYNFAEWSYMHITKLLYIAAYKTPESIIDFADKYFPGVDYDADVIADEVEQEDGWTREQMMFDHLLACSQGNVI